MTTQAPPADFWLWERDEYPGTERCFLSFLPPIPPCSPSSVLLCCLAAASRLFFHSNLLRIYFPLTFYTLPILDQMISFSSALVPNWGGGLRDIWQCLQTFLIVKAGESSTGIWCVGARGDALRCCNEQDAPCYPPPPKKESPGSKC